MTMENKDSLSPQEAAAKLALKANEATIHSAKYAKPGFIVAVLSLIVAMASFCLVFLIKDSISMSSPTIVFGIRTDEDNFRNRIIALPGEEVTAEIICRNTTGAQLDMAVRISLPDSLEYVPETAMIYNSLNPDGAPISEDIISDWVNLGTHSIYTAETGHGESVIVFKTRVAESSKLPPGRGAINMAAHVAGYKGARLTTDTIYQYVTIDVVDSVQ
jgi:hypothetical protein